MSENSFQYDDHTYNTKSAAIIAPILMEWFHPMSVVDVGCGQGDWLKVFEELGVKDILGIDGEWIMPSDLRISKQYFLESDLSKSFKLDKRYDLVLCLEVAEHLPESSVDIFVDTLANLGDTIIFSAAIPNQGGQNHLNEQWTSYWVEKFRQHDFLAYDIIRPMIWEDDGIHYWYRQNMFILSKEELRSAEIEPTRLVHPQLLQSKAKIIQNYKTGNMGIRTSFAILLKAIGNFVRRILS